MPYPIQNLIQGRGEPMAARPNDKVSSAIAVMVEYDFGQLPVVDDAYKPLGMITYQSIVAAMDYFKTEATQLLVSHATVKAERFSPEDDLFDLLDRLQDKYAILIVNRDQRLVGIVTTYDSTAYFRQRAEDMMLVEDIESMIKDLILSAFGANGEGTSGAQLEQAVAQITDTGSRLYGQYERALRDYLKQTTSDEMSANVDQDALTHSFAKFGPAPRQRDFDDLTLADYITLLLHDTSWNVYADVVKLERTSIRGLLNTVREMRNSLAHFRGELSPTQRDRLRFCWNWLRQIQPAIRVDWPEPQTQVTAEVSKSAGQPSADAEQIVSILEYEDQPDNNDSKYAALALFLHTLPGRQDRISLSFEQIERIMGTLLPPTAREHRTWWANDSVGHVQSQQWLDAGWRVAQINMAEGVVTFARTQGREKAYIDFFARFLTDLKAKSELPIAVSSPGGQSWIQLGSVADENVSGLYYIAAFTRNKKFRIEVYIDTGDAVRNKAVFDQLQAQRATIETKLGSELNWERLDAKRASRIAWYHAGSIQDSAEKLEELRRWAVDALIQFRRTLDEAVPVAMDALFR